MTELEARAVLAHKSKSFALAAKLLPRACRDDVAVLYAYCRRADDAVDEAKEADARRNVQRLREELWSIYAGQPQSEPLLAAFQRVVVTHRIPEQYPSALLDGLASDLGRVRVSTVEELLLYCHRVAGVVGLMLCHLFGVSDRRALSNADDLGIAMQLTNVCRDVAEDRERDRVYLPACWLAAGPPERAVKQALELAERYYRSGDAGLYALPFRVAVAVRAARLVYSAIGDEISRRGYDVFAGRAVVPGFRKLWLVLCAVRLELAARLFSRRPPELEAGAADGR